MPRRFKGSSNARIVRCRLPSERQRRGVKAIETLHGKLLYFGEVPAREAWYQDLDDMPRPLLPDFLRRWLPRDYFDRVQEVNFSGTWAGLFDRGFSPCPARSAATC